MDLSVIRYDTIKAIYAKKKYPFCTSLQNPNITGIRIATPIVDSFCDYFVYTWNDRGPQIRIVQGTTDPGLYWMQNLMNPDGVAIVKEGYYPGLWIDGLHSGYRALSQNADVTVFRDADKDGHLDTRDGSEQTGRFGIDHHHAWANGVAPGVGQWSAGCQTVYLISDWNKIIIPMMDMQINSGHGNTFSYGLINEKDFYL